MRILFVTGKDSICSLSNGYIYLKSGKKIDARAIKGVVSFVTPKIILRAGLPCVHICGDSLIPYNLKVNYIPLVCFRKYIVRIADENFQICRKILAKNSKFVWIKSWEHLIAVLRFPRLLELSAGAVALLLMEDGDLSVNPFSILRVGKVDIYVWEIMFSPLLSAIVGRELGSALENNQGFSKDPRECANVVMSYVISSRAFVRWHERCVSLLFRKGIYKPHPSKSHSCFATYS